MPLHKRTVWDEGSGLFGERGRCAASHVRTLHTTYADSRRKRASDGKRTARRLHARAVLSTSTAWRIMFHTAAHLNQCTIDASDEERPPGRFGVSASRKDPFSASGPRGVRQDRCQRSVSFIMRRPLVPLARLRAWHRRCDRFATQAPPGRRRPSSARSSLFVLLVFP